MSASLTIDDLRRIASAAVPDPGRVDLDAERLSHLTTLERVMAATEGRARKADEQRLIDRAAEAVDLIDLTTRKMHAGHKAPLDRRVSEAASLRARNPHLFPDSGRSEVNLGARLADAIGEVREGRAQAFVDFDTRALAESNTGSYGVNTVMGDPVYSLAANSVVMALPGVRMVTATTGDRMRFPRFNAVTVGGVAESAALTAAAADLDAVDIVFQKYSTYETLSTELEEDFSAPALTVLGERMLRDLGARVDSGLIQGTGAADTVGIFSQAGVSTTSVAALPADFDKVDEAIYQLELNDGNARAWLMHPRSWRILKQIKTGISSDKTTLLSDPQNAPSQLRGLPVYTTSGISITSGATSVGSTAAVLDPSQIVVVTRRAPRLEVSRDVAFSTDMVAIRATTRIGLGVIDPAGGISLLTDIRAS
jgi:HK97 family phage major capsid protein